MSIYYVLPIEGVNNYDSVLGLDLMVFEECQLRSCVNATIRDDTIVERDEEVLFSLEEVIMNEQNITLEPAEALVMIVDDDGKCCDTYVP